MYLVCPAGSPPALVTAIDHGADAVYVGFRDQTNARAFPGLNFTEADLRAGVAYAHARGRKVYVALNTYPGPAHFARLAGRRGPRGGARRRRNHLRGHGRARLRGAALPRTAPPPLGAGLGHHACRAALLPRALRDRARRAAAGAVDPAGRAPLRAGRRADRGVRLRQPVHHGRGPLPAVELRHRRLAEPPRRVLAGEVRALGRGAGRRAPGQPQRPADRPLHARRTRGLSDRVQGPLRRGRRGVPRARGADQPQHARAAAATRRRGRGRAQDRRPPARAGLRGQRDAHLAGRASTGSRPGRTAGRPIRSGSASSRATPKATRPRSAPTTARGTEAPPHAPDPRSPAVLLAARARARLLSRGGGLAARRDLSRRDRLQQTSRTRARATGSRSPTSWPTAGARSCSPRSRCSRRSRSSARCADWSRTAAAASRPTTCPRCSCCASAACASSAARRSTSTTTRRCGCSARTASSDWCSASSTAAHGRRVPRQRPAAARARDRGLGPPAAVVLGALLHGPRARPRQGRLRLPLHRLPRRPAARLARRPAVPHHQRHLGADLATATSGPSSTNLRAAGIRSRASIRRRRARRTVVARFRARTRQPAWRRRGSARRTATGTARRACALVEPAQSTVSR